MPSMRQKLSSQSRLVLSFSSPRIISISSVRRLRQDLLDVLGLASTSTLGARRRRGDAFPLRRLRQRFRQEERPHQTFRRTHGGQAIPGADRPVTNICGIRNKV